jgi:hypothetical protein
MILILASIYNERAKSYVKQFPDSSASLITCSDIAEHKLKIFYPDFNNSEITIAGRTLSVREITGVINLLPVVLPEELFFFPEKEREYQSAEIQALLTFFLSALSCPVINKPSALSLNGNVNSHVNQIEFAIQCKFPVVKSLFDSSKVSSHFKAGIDEEIFEVDYFNAEIISNSTAETDDFVRKLASHAGVIYLKVFFSKMKKNIRFLRASAIPDIENTALHKAICNHLKIKSIP